MSLKDMAGFTRRVGISVNAGLSIVDAVKREAARQRNDIWRGAARSMEQGNSFAESIKPYKNKLGEMFVALIEVGEESGRLGEMLSDMASYYEEMLRIRRDFLKSLVLPAVELIAAVFIVGILILALGFIEGLTGNRIDLLGFGLVGFSGFLKYVFFLATVAGAGVFAYFWVKRSVERSRAVHYFLYRIPKIGKLLMSLALVRLTWGLSMTMRTGMDVRRALSLSFRGVGFAPVGDNLPTILAVVENGGSLTDAFLAADRIDRDLITGVDTGEQSGNFPEMMQKLTDQYLQEALLDLKIVSVVAGFAVWGFVALILVVLIFRLAMFYLGALNSALEM